MSIFVLTQACMINLLILKGLLCEVLRLIAVQASSTPHVAMIAQGHGSLTGILMARPAYKGPCSHHSVSMH